MAVSVGDLAEFVNASPAEPTLPTVLAEALELVNGYLRPAGVQRCPPSTYDLAVKTLASELFARRSSPGGVAQWGPDGQPVRLARDPLVAIRPLLGQYRGLGRPG